MQNGRLSLVKFLIVEKNTNVNRVHNDSKTPLWFASQVWFFSSLLFQFNSQPWLMNQNGHFEIVELLLAKGASIDHVNHMGHTLLWIAVYVWICCCFSASRVCVKSSKSKNLQKLIFKSKIARRLEACPVAGRQWRRNQ